MTPRRLKLWSLFCSKSPSATCIWWAYSFHSEPGASMCFLGVREPACQLVLSVYVDRSVRQISTGFLVRNFCPWRIVRLAFKLSTDCNRKDRILYELVKQWISNLSVWSWRPILDQKGFHSMVMSGCFINKILMKIGFFKVLFINVEYHLWFCRYPQGKLQLPTGTCLGCNKLLNLKLLWLHRCCCISVELFRFVFIAVSYVKDRSRMSDWTDLPLLKAGSPVRSLLR